MDRLIFHPFRVLKKRLTYLYNNFIPSGLKIQEKHILFSILVIVTLLPLNGCLVGGKFHKPEVQTDAQYPQQTAPSDSITNIQWFELYRDSVLQGFIKLTLDSNRDMLTAAARIEEAKQILGFVKSNFYPQLGYGFSAGYGTAGSEARQLGNLEGGSVNLYGTLDWEIDLWGKVRHQKKSAQAKMLAEVENRNALMVSLVAQTAESYFILRDLDNRLQIAQRTVTSRQENTRIITERFDKGYTSELDKMQAIQQESIAASQIPNLQRQIVYTENALRTLMGMRPGTVVRGLSNYDQTFVPEIPAGLPSQLLERRPDIREAEKRLESQFNQIGVAKARMFPSISLTGLLGVASPAFATLMTGGGFLANGIAGIFGPLFQFNKNRRLKKAEEFKTQQTLYQYEQTILEAFADVDNSLAGYRTYNEEYDILKKQVEASRKALELSQARYDFGYTDYTEVIIQQTNLFDAELQESFTLQRKLNSTVTLYRSLGGGW